MAWRTLVVNCHSKLSYRNNHLLFQSADRMEQIHLSEIDVLILENTMITMTTMLIKRLIDEKIAVIFCDDKALPIANLSALYSRYDSAAQLEKQILWDNEIKDKVLQQIFLQKMTNQSALLKSNDLLTKVEAIDDLILNVNVSDPVNTEAQIAKMYFKSLFGADFHRRELTDINAGLNYGYSILLSMVAREIAVNGCITQLGINHCNQFNQFNFASDLMEPFRVLVDQIVYENRHESFVYIKRRILDIFNRTYKYHDKNAYLTNIISDYVRRIIRALNREITEIDEFRYEL